MYIQHCNMLHVHVQCTCTGVYIKRKLTVTSQLCIFLLNLLNLQVHTSMHVYHDLCSLHTHVEILRAVLDVM